MKLDEPHLVGDSHRVGSAGKQPTRQLSSERRTRVRAAAVSHFQPFPAHQLSEKSTPRQPYGLTLSRGRSVSKTGRFLPFPFNLRYKQ